MPTRERPVQPTVIADKPRAFTDTKRFKLMRTAVGAANPLIKMLLESRLGAPLARALMLFRYRGRKSGRTYTTPVGYVRAGDRVVIVTSPAYTWWRNVVGGADVSVRLDGLWRSGRASLLYPRDPGYDEAVALHVAKRGPDTLRSLGLPVTDAGRVPSEARETAPRYAHIVRIDLEPRSELSGR